MCTIIGAQTWEVWLFEDKFIKFGTVLISMPTYIVGTDGVPASEAISDYLKDRVDQDDSVEVVYATVSDESEAQEALDVFEEQLGSVTNVNTQHINYRDEGPGSGPVETILHQAKETEADQMVIGLRRHTRTERIIFGSVSHSLIEKVTIPLLLVPLPGYQPNESS